MNERSKQQVGEVTGKKTVLLLYLLHNKDLDPSFGKLESRNVQWELE